tara:strand:- start:35724 stop:38147 length:2424 start_codon:yes stop_codon:yes gene_type:complete
MRKIVFLFVLILQVTVLFSQEEKKLIATRIINSPNIDGQLNDSIWAYLPYFDNFNMLEPGTDSDISAGYQTRVQFAYDDTAVYIAAYMNDPDPENTASQFSQRDDLRAQADFIAVALNTYNDGINETRFGVTSSGTIFDSKISINDEDLGYNVVFQCKTSRDDKGWYAEFKIPYNALRFPEIDIQNWSINFYRRIININETHSFAPIDITKGRSTIYNAPVIGVKNINPPIRLTLFPFAQGVVSTFNRETSSSFSAGMDLKYGLSDSFTLDATLIPDFGQAAFDEVTLNLGPFEQTFDEQRQFFTEGTELFNKGRLFFSRRVGGPPSGTDIDLDENEVVSILPESVNLLNAIKVSGRTKDNLGVGFFNAITEKTYATVKDEQTGTLREVLVEPLTNYSILVLDQQFNDNSTISLINTNVTRDGQFRDANATAVVFDVSDKENTYNASGRTVVSNVHLETGMNTGFLSEIELARIKGKLRYRLEHKFANTTYDINDLGLNRRNNFNNLEAEVSFQSFEPTKIFNKYRFELTARHRRLYDPNVSTGDSFRLETFFVLKSRIAFGGFIDYRSDNDNYFEPRLDGKFVTFSKSIGGRVFVSSDYRKKLAIDLGMGQRKDFDQPQQQFFIDFSPRFRFSDKFLVLFNSEFSKRDNQFGYIDNTETDVFFGQRDLISIENSLTASFNFDPYKAINLRFRNFWTSVDYSDDIFFKLNDDGTKDIIDYEITQENDPNRNFNIWNLDLSFRWRFAPGSEASLLYRNQIFNSDNQATLGYTESLNTLFRQSMQNTVSLRVTYFIDYNNARRLFKKTQ